ncbi:hypothetical protein V8G54_027362 [Vigna mungo]|uniref:Uncharacterized protein n=1 Tax=Vigna mungo TaxID=3915 RepID=A0AAQ3RQE1_VIGMU
MKLGYLDGKVKEENAELATSVANCVKGYDTFGHVLQKQHQLRQNSNAGEFHVSIHVGRPPRPHVHLPRPHVTQHLPSVRHCHVYRTQVHGVHVSVADLERQQHGDVHGDGRHRVHLYPPQLQPHDLQIWIRRPQNIERAHEQRHTQSARDNTTP